MKTKEQVEYMTKKLADQGRLIETGWVALRYMAIPDTAPEVQITEMRKAFFAGAQHVWGSLMTFLEPGTEPTARDLERVTLIDNELKQWVEEMKLLGLEMPGSVQ